MAIMNFQESVASALTYMGIIGKYRLRNDHPEQGLAGLSTDRVIPVCCDVAQ